MANQKEDFKGKNIRRPLKNGKRVKYWQYEFSYNGKRYGGSTGTTSKEKAEKFVKDEKEKLKTDTNTRSKDRALQNLIEREKNQEFGESIKIKKVWETFRKKAPSLMKRLPSERKWKEKHLYWNDFKCFLESKDIQTMRAVTKSITQEYVGLLKTSGKFNKVIKSSTGDYVSKMKKLSSSTINSYITQLQQIFEILKEDACIYENPFAHIPKLKLDTKKRDMFNLSELESIDAYLCAGKLWEKCSNKTLDLLVLKTLFIIGLNTGLRRGDICTLKWSEIDLLQGVIRRTLYKTDVEVVIPMNPPLWDFFTDDFTESEDGYLFPELAEMYRTNVNGINYRFKQMLNDLDIKSNRNDTGRTMNVSSKGVHSLRHSFCYLHGMGGTALFEVQSMVGHLSKKMTEYYMLHKSETIKRAGQKALAEFTSFKKDEKRITSKSEISKEEILALVGKMTADNWENIKTQILK